MNTKIQSDNSTLNGRLNKRETSNQRLLETEPINQHSANDRIMNITRMSDQENSRNFGQNRSTFMSKSNELGPQTMGLSTDIHQGTFELEDFTQRYNAQQKDTQKSPETAFRKK